MSELAAECGFSSPAVFSRAFTRHFGISPSLMKDRFLDDIRVMESLSQVQIVELPEFYLYYEATEMYAPDLQTSFQSARNKALSFGLKPTARNIGLMNHLSVHRQEKKLNYLAGVVLEGTVPMYYWEDIFVIPSGKYASFTTQYPRENFIQELTDLKYNWLDKSDFTLRELFALEEFSESLTMERTVYLPLIKR